MDDRKKKILQAIINDYVKYAEPVASRTIARKYNLGISPATIRNEMYDLEELGLLEQPHSSSGRIPSAKGYRYYVDYILQKENLSIEDVALLNSLWETHPNDFTDIIQNTAKIISRISHNMSMVLSPMRDKSIIRFLHVLPINEYRAILVIVTDTGALDNELILFDEPYDRYLLESTSTKMNNALTNVAIKDIDKTFLLKKVLEIKEPLNILKTLGESIYRAITKRKLSYSVGTPELLGQPEFKDVSTVQPILNLIEEQEALSKILTNNPNEPITVLIGTENMDSKIHNCSIIQAEFNMGSEHLGTLAILGPTRMEYARLVGMLQYMQQYLQSIAEDNNK